jgi:cytochrome P450 family 110
MSTKLEIETPTAAPATLSAAPTNSLPMPQSQLSHRSRSWFGRMRTAVRGLNCALQLARDPEGFFERQRRRLGPTFWIDLPGADPTLVTGDPAAAKQIFGSAVDVFDAPKNQPLEPVFGRNSIVLNSGEAHRQRRNLVLPAFRRDRMALFGGLMQQITCGTLERLRPGETCYGQVLAQEITLHIILHSIFGVTEPAAAKIVEQAVVRFIHAYTPMLMLVPFFRHPVLSGGQWTRFLRARQELDDLLDDHITARRADPEPGADILSQLIHLDDEHGQKLSNEVLKDELRTMLIAGHDTTASTIAWAMYFLHTQPSLRERVLNELKPLGPQPSAADLHELPFLEAVCQEALRLHPPVPLAIRKVKEPLQLGRHCVQPGENVAVSLRLLHTVDEIWPDGSEFRPERFLGHTYTPWEFAPFGGGGRRCVGAAFGAFELRVVLGTMLAAAEFETATKSPPLPALRGVVVVPHNRVPLRFLGPRNSA